MSTTFTIAELNAALPGLQRFAMSLTRDEDQARDLVQDSVERSLRKSKLYKPGTNFRSWIFTICKRIFLNQVRKEKAQGYQVDLEDAPQSHIASSSDQESTIQCKEMLGCFYQLNPRDRLVLSLIAVEGMKYEEAAIVLDIPVGTVRSRLSRARARLKEMIESNEQPPEAVVQ